MALTFTNDEIGEYSSAETLTRRAARHAGQQRRRLGRLRTRLAERGIGLRPGYVSESGDDPPGYSERNTPQRQGSVQEVCGRGRTRRRRGHFVALWQHDISLIQRKPGALRNGAPFEDLPAPLQALRRSLLRNPGGDRAMAGVLALVPTAGLDAVLVAVELALEGAPPSGRISTEHVLNVLERLTALPAPENAATSLQIATPPLADTARYDRLRAVDDAEETRPCVT